jgi:protein-tyrosine kinase
MSIIEKAAGRIEHGRQERAPAQARAADSSAAAGPARGDGVGHGHGHGAATATAMPPLPSAPPPPGAPGAPPRRTREVELDLARMQERGLITVAGGRTLQVEDFRVIKRPILKKAFPGGTAVLPSNLVMITSALAGEGKTYCSINLAMSIAMELDHTVLLIDADVARPSVLKALGLPPQPGLMDLLLDDSLDLADVMLRTNVNTLSILPAGTANLRATELLASQSMKALVQEIAQRYPDRIVIFDSPPLLLTSEARVLAGHMGQIVVVVESQQTTQHAVLEGLRRLEGCDNVSLIYNKSRDFAGTETYDYHYG